MYCCPFLKVLGKSKAVCGLGLCCWPWYQVFLAQGSSHLSCSPAGVELAAQIVSVDVKDPQYHQGCEHICRRHWTKDPRNHRRISWLTRSLRALTVCPTQLHFCVWSTQSFQHLWHPKMAKTCLFPENHYSLQHPEVSLELKGQLLCSFRTRRFLLLASLPSTTKS